MKSLFWLHSHWLHMDKSKDVAYPKWQTDYKIQAYLLQPCIPWYNIQKNVEFQEKKSTFK